MHVVMRRQSPSIATDNIFVAGVYDSSLDLGAGPLPSKSGSYLAKFDPEGQADLGQAIGWSRSSSRRSTSTSIPPTTCVVAATSRGDLEKPIVASAVDRDGIVLKIAPRR